MRDAALCCKGFTLRITPEELWENYRYFFLQDGPREDCKPERDGNGNLRWSGMEVVIESLRYRGFRVPEYREGCGNSREPAHIYSCALLCPVTGRCKVYALRPHMCSNYPSGRQRCEWAPSCESSWCAWHPDNHPLCGPVEPLRKAKITFDPEVFLKVKEAV